MLTSHMTHASILGLNALLVDSPSSLTETYTAETQSIICQGVSNKDVSLFTGLSSFVALISVTAFHCREQRPRGREVPFDRGRESQFRDEQGHLRSASALHTGGRAS